MSRDQPNFSDANASADPGKDDLRTDATTRSRENGDGADAENEEPAVADSWEGNSFEAAPDEPTRPNGGRKLRILGQVLVLLATLAAAAIFAGRHFVRNTMRENLPQLDGSQPVYGLAAAVTVERDTHGVPHIRANSMDDLVFAQGFVTAQDRLWQMDLLRRHAAGDARGDPGPLHAGARPATANTPDTRLRRPRHSRSARRSEALDGGVCARSERIDRDPALPLTHRVPRARLPARGVEATGLHSGGVGHVSGPHNGIS